MLSYHLFAPYIGWSKFRTELGRVADQLFSKTRGTVVRRLGLRYLNALRPDLHNIKAVTDLDLSVVVMDKTLSGNVNLNFTDAPAVDKRATVRVATPDFVTGLLPTGTSVFVDVDVYTPPGFQARSANRVHRWLESAHETEKDEFFSLLKPETITQLDDK